MYSLINAWQNQDYFELTPESSRLVGFPEHHTQGSLWKILQEAAQETHVPEKFHKFIQPSEISEQQLEQAEEQEKKEQRAEDHAQREIFS